MRYLTIVCIIVAFSVISISGTDSLAKSAIDRPSMEYYKHPGITINLDGNSFNVSVPYVYMLEDGIPFIGFWNQSSWKLSESGNINRSYSSTITFSPEVGMLIQQLKALYLLNNNNFPTGLSSKDLLGTNISFNQPIQYIMMQYEKYLNGVLVNISTNTSNPLYSNISGSLNMLNQFDLFHILQKLSIKGEVFTNVTEFANQIEISSYQNSTDNMTEINSTNSLEISFQIMFHGHTFGNSTLFMFQNSFLSNGVKEKYVKYHRQVNDRSSSEFNGYLVNLTKTFPLMYIWGNQFEDNGQTVNFSSYESITPGRITTIGSFPISNNTSTFYEDPYLIFPSQNINSNFTINNIGSTAINIILNNFEYFSIGIFLGLLMIGGGYTYYKGKRSF